MPENGPKRTAMTDAGEILNRVRQLVRALRTFEREAQSKYGIGAAQMFILHVLLQDDDISLNELADRTATDQSSASLAVARLVDEGYVRRTTSAEDRRQVRLALTPKGRTIVRRSPPAAQQRIMESVREMSTAERTKLMTLLDKLITGLGVEGDRGSMLFQDEQPAKPAPKRKPARVR